MRRPVAVALSTGAFLLILGFPFTQVRFTSVDASVLPESYSGRQVDTALRRDFTADTTSPIEVVIDAPASAAPAVQGLTDAIRNMHGVVQVPPPQPIGSNTWLISVVAGSPTLSDSSRQLVNDIRALHTDYPVHVGGGTADFVDLQASLLSRLPLAIAIVALTTILVLVGLTGSLLLPVKAVVMNALSLSAAFGILVFIFQDGRLTSLLQYQSQGALESTQPILLFAIAFGLSTDYGVFLINRIKEGHDAGLSTTDAVAQGLARTGRIVTAAAGLFTIAIGAFATSSIIFIKEVGVGTALAVIIDATIVRALLVPSLMKLLGEWNWWAPRSLRALHRRLKLDHLEGAPATPTVTGTRSVA
jgi:RND superfamily putative drug exporter